MIHLRLLRANNMSKFNCKVSLSWVGLNSENNLYLNHRPPSELFIYYMTVCVSNLTFFQLFYVTSVLFTKLLVTKQRLSDFSYYTYSMYNDSCVTDDITITRITYLYQSSHNTNRCKHIYYTIKIIHKL